MALHGKCNVTEIVNANGSSNKLEEARSSTPEEIRTLLRHPRHHHLKYHPQWHLADEEDESWRCCPRFFNPTTLTFFDPNNNTKVNWYSREHRKGRFGRVVKAAGQKVHRPRYKLWGFEWCNISWWVAQLFTWGSVMWVLNGHFLFFPGQGPSANFDLYITSYTALVGGTLFWFGAYFAIIEALNIAEEVKCGHEMKFDGSEKGKDCVLYLGASAGLGTAVSEPGGKVEQRCWWIPRSHRFHDWGFMAAVIQFTGATLFSISTILAVPGVLPPESSTYFAVWDATFWTLQVVGSWGFIISAAMFCLEVQSRWWKPKFFNLGWQIGFWNVIGAFGFEFSAIFGYWAAAGKYQRFGSAFSTYWGGWAFLIGSYLQVLEVVNKHPTD